MSVIYGLSCLVSDQYTHALRVRWFCRLALAASLLMSLASTGLSLHALWSPPLQVLAGLLVTLPCLCVWAAASRTAWRAL